MVGGMECYTPEQEQVMLNKQASEGWELMSVVQKERVTWFYFRKRVATPNDPKLSDSGPGARL